MDGGNWRQALEVWQEQEAAAQRAREEAATQFEGHVPVGWWLDAFRNPPSPSAAAGHKCGEKEVLAVVAYDISDPKRLSYVARHCEDYGVRVQYSIFECRMDAEEFELFWMELKDLIEPDEDRLVAYKICAACAQRIGTAGTMVSNQTHVVYIF